MKRKAILIILCLFAFFISVESQSTEKNKAVTVQADYDKAAMGKILKGNVNYPEQAVTKNIQGDVIISCRINKEGKADSMAIVSTPGLVLSTSSIIILNALSEGWTPASIDNTPIDKSYNVVFRYRIYANSRPSDYKSLAAKAAGREKFEKALENYNKAIIENPYDFELFEARAKVRDLNGNAEGAEKDRQEALRIRDEILFFIDVTAFRMSVTTTQVVSREIVAVPVR